MHVSLSNGQSIGRSRVMKVALALVLGGRQEITAGTSPVKSWRRSETSCFGLSRRTLIAITASGRLEALHTDTMVPVSTTRLPFWRMVSGSHGQRSSAAAVSGPAAGGVSTTRE